MAFYKLSADGVDQAREAVAQKQAKELTYEKMAAEIGVETKTLRKFLSGEEKQQQGTFVRCCEYFGLNWRKVHAPLGSKIKGGQFLSDAVSNHADESFPSISSKESERYSQWIRWKTEKFTGRQFVWDEIANFLRSCPQGGYFLLMAEPGAGKSSILAQYVSSINTDCIAYFNPSVLPYTTKDFLVLLRQQIIKRYQINPESLIIPGDSRRYEDFLYDLLQAASQRSSKPIVLAIDALDEVDSQTHVSGANILCLPRLLPKNICCIMTARSQDDNEHHYFRSTESPLVQFDLQDRRYQSENIADTKDYIREQRLAVSSELCQQVAALGKTEEEFIEEFAKFGNGNFMYVVYVINDLEHGKYQDKNINFESFLAELPRNLEQYYLKHWREMVKDSTIPPETKLKIAAYLASIGEAVTLDWFIQSLSYTSEADIYNLREALKEWGQFLHRRIDASFTRYCIYHASFRDFVFRHPDLDHYRRSIMRNKKASQDTITAEEFIEDVAAQMVDSLTQGFFEDEDDEEEI